MKIAQARKLLTEDIGRMTLEQLQRHRVKLTDAWRESRAEYGMGRAAKDGFYRQTGEDVTESTRRPICGSPRTSRTGSTRPSRESWSY